MSDSGSRKMLVEVGHRFGSRARCYVRIAMIVKVRKLKYWNSRIGTCSLTCLSHHPIHESTPSFASITMGLMEQREVLDDQSRSEYGASASSDIEE